MTHRRLRLSGRSLWSCAIVCLLIAAVAFAVPATAFARKTAEAKAVHIYILDVGVGDTTLVMLPNGKNLLIDTADGRMATRVYDFLQQHNVNQIDYLFITNFQSDHTAALAALAQKIPILTIFDHGESVMYHKSEDWWQQRRGALSSSTGVARGSDAQYEAFLAARTRLHHVVVHPGDRLPIDGIDATVVSGSLSHPLRGAGQANPACTGLDKRVEDDTEDGATLGLLIHYGKFGFIDLSDTVWNNSNRLFCPVNKVGRVDAYLVSHTGQSLPLSLGEYYYGLTCCSPAELEGLHPRVGILSIAKTGHRHGDPDSIDRVRNFPGMDLWQTNKIVSGPETGHNAPDQFIANMGEPSGKVLSIDLAASRNGSFTVTNPRNGFSKNYPPAKN